MTSKTKLILTVAVTSAFSVLQAQTLVNYVDGTTDANGPESSTVTNTTDIASASTLSWVGMASNTSNWNLTGNGNLAFDPAGNYFRASNSDIGSSVADGTEYARFTITNNGDALDLDEFTFDMHGQTKNLFTNRYIQYSAALYTDAASSGTFVQLGSTLTFNTPGTRPNDNNVDFGTTSFDLSTITLAANQTVEFRLSFGDKVFINGADNGGVAGTNSGIGLQNVSVTAVPEPSTIALVGICLGAVALFRRRR